MNEMIGAVCKNYSQVLKGQHKMTDGHMPCKSCHDVVIFNSIKLNFKIHLLIPERLLSVWIKSCHSWLPEVPYYNLLSLIQIMKEKLSLSALFLLLQFRQIATINTVSSFDFTSTNSILISIPFKTLHTSYVPTEMLIVFLCNLN